MKGIILDRGSIGQDIDLSSILELNIDWTVRHKTSLESLESLEDFNIIVTNKVPITKKYLLKNKRLKLISLLATGYNNVDIATAKSLGIPVCNARSYCTDSVAQHTCGLILTLARNIASYNNSVRKGHWAESEFFHLSAFPIKQIDGDSILIYGHGELGRAVEKMTRALGMKPHCINSKTSDEDIDRLISDADWITLHCPSTDKTRGMVDSKFLNKMKTSAFLINTARGDLVVENHLMKALHEKSIAGAALDVLSIEPPDASSPITNHNLSNLIITPHIAWISQKSQQQLIEETYLNIAAFLKGEPRNCVY